MREECRKFFDFAKNKATHVPYFRESKNASMSLLGLASWVMNPPSPL